MSPRERVLAVFSELTPDEVPVHHIGFSSYAASIILGREAYVGGGIQQWREAVALWKGEEAHKEFLERSLKDAFELVKATDQDILRLEYWRMSEKPTKRIDDYTFFYGDPNGVWRIMRFNPETELYQTIAQNPPKKELTIEDIEKIVENEEEKLEKYHPNIINFDKIARWMEIFGDNWVIRINEGGIGIPNDTLSSWLKAIILRQDIVARYLDIQTERAIKNIKILAELNVKIIFGGHDLASNNGPFYSPHIFRKLMLHRIKKIADECHKYNMYYLFGSDGNLWPIADDLFGKSGVDGYFEIDRRAGMDLKKLRERYPKLVLIGNISSYTLSKGTVEDVIAETISCINEARHSGRIIVGASNYIVPRTPKENIIVMLEIIRKMKKIS